MNLRDRIEQRCASSLSCGQKADAIMSLLPKPRYPEKDGWPENHWWRLLVMSNGGNLYMTSLKELRQDECLGKVKWWLPVSEILALVEGK